MAGIYIHFPFCVKKCRYCDFYSITKRELIPEFIQALKREISLTGESPFSDLTFKSVYFGGGTPSLIKTPDIGDILSLLFGKFKFADNVEITLESNPGAADNREFEKLKNTGINRLSIGCQSFNDDELRLMGRIHTAKEAWEFTSLAKSVFDNISIDLIYGLPGQTEELFLKNLHTAVNLKPNNISTYMLSWSDKTPLGRMIKTGKVPYPDQEIVSSMYLATHRFLINAGYQHYEISNFALNNRKSIHNMGYWDHTPYLGLGPSAHSFYGSQRMWNIDNVFKYIRLLENHKKPAAGTEKLSQEQILLEKISLGLRTYRGVELDLLTDAFDIISDLIRTGYAKKNNNRLILTPKGMLVADEIAARFAKTIL